MSTMLYGYIAMFCNKCWGAAARWIAGAVAKNPPRYSLAYY